MPADAFAEGNGIRDNLDVCIRIIDKKLYKSEHQESEEARLVFRFYFLLFRIDLCLFRHTFFAKGI